MGRTTKRIGLTQRGADEGGSTSRTSTQIENYSRNKRTFQYKKNDRGKIIKIPMLTGGQAKIAAKAPPPNKLDGKDFAVLRAEKAKGRGMGLQDEKVQPGKVMKAKRGKSIMTEKVKSKNFAGYTKAFEGPQNKGRVSTISGVKPTLRGGRSKTARTAITASSLKKNLMKTKNPYSDLVKTTAKGPENFMKRRAIAAKALNLGKKTRIGKIALGVAAAGIGAKKYLESKMNKKDVKKKKSGGIIQKMYESGKLEKFKLTPKQRANMVKKAKLSLKATRESLTDRNQPMKAQRLRDSLLPPKKMAGGVASPTQVRGRQILRQKKQVDPSQSPSEKLKIYLFDKDKFKNKPQIDVSNASKKMGGGMMKKYSKGGGADTGTAGESRSIKGVAINKLTRAARSIPKNIGTRYAIKKLVNRIKGDIRDSSKTKMMGGGMMQRPMGYSKGTMIKARGCKLGRTRPTKIT